MDGRFSFIFLFLRLSPRCRHRRRSRRRKYLSPGSSDRVRKKRRRKERNGVQPECASEEITLAPVTSYIRILIYRPLSPSLSPIVARFKPRSTRGTTRVPRIRPVGRAGREELAISRNLGPRFFKRRIPARVTKFTEPLPSPLFRAPLQGTPSNDVAIDIGR